ncbi:MAG: outer membrane beta-barrel protein [Chthonomonadaceae bacterium]|nr:outer membrane beta-barrel protein [Chthonomonadaceae bacterium]
MKTSIAPALTAVMAIASVSAHAQYQKPIGASLRLGLFYPSNGQARDIEGQGWFGGGLEYKLKDLHFDMSNPKGSATLTISADYYGKGSFSHVPLLLNYVGHNDQFFYSAGAGIGFGRTIDGKGNTSNDSEFAFQFGAGYDFVKSQMPLFVEIKYFGSSEAKLAGFGIFGGVRF